MLEKYQFSKIENVKQSEQLSGPVVIAIVECIKKAFGEAPEDTQEHISGDEILLATLIDNPQILGYFSAFHDVSPQYFFKDPLLTEKSGSYISAITIDGEHQGKGISKEMYKRSLTPRLKERLPLLFTRTQNPRVEAGITTYLQQAIKERLLGNFVLDRKLIEGVYGQMLTTTKPISDNDQVQLEYSLLNQSSGDAYLLMYHLLYEQSEDV